MESVLAVHMHEGRSVDYTQTLRYRNSSRDRVNWLLYSVNWNEFREMQYLLSPSFAVLLFSNASKLQWLLDERWVPVSSNWLHNYLLFYRFILAIDDITILESTRIIIMIILTMAIELSILFGGCIIVTIEVYILSVKVWLTREQNAKFHRLESTNSSESLPNCLCACSSFLCVTRKQNHNYSIWNWTIQKFEDDNGQKIIHFFLGDHSMTILMIASIAHLHESLVAPFLFIGFVRTIFEDIESIFL